MVDQLTRADVVNAWADEILERAQKNARPGFKHTTPSGTPTTNYMHGPGGIFGVSGLERDVISTRVQPSGLAGFLPAIGSTTMFPMFPYLTGNLADTGDNPDGVCDDGPVAGLTKACIQTAQFGRYTRMTKEIELNRVGQQIDRGEFFDLALINDPLLSNEGGILQQNIDGNAQLNREVRQAFVEVGIAFQNLLIQQTYVGNPVNNTGAGGYAEFPGLDILIGTGKVDAITSTNCPSLDSDIKDFNYGLVDNINAGTDIVEVVTYMYRFLTSNAERMNLMPATWGITMRRDLFYELTAIWPCSYLTYRCTFRDDSSESIVNGADQVALRDRMRNGRFLLIDGVEVPVITDDGIVEETDADNANILAGQFASDIYMIPLTIVGTRPATFFEYLDFNQGPLQARDDGRLGESFWTDGGRFLWHAKPPTNWCNQWIAKIHPRIRLSTPQLAGRIQNVRYAPLQHTRDPFPSDPYFVDGGETVRAGPSLFSDWNLP